MATRTAIEDEHAHRSECWCCGRIEDPSRLVHLGHHPEVMLCTGCAHWVSKLAWEIEDQARSGIAVRARDRFRRARRSVVEHGWHHSRLVGRPLRWMGRWLP